MFYFYMYDVAVILLVGSFLVCLRGENSLLGLMPAYCVALL